MSTVTSSGRAPSAATAPLEMSSGRRSQDSANVRKGNSKDTKAIFSIKLVPGANMNIFQCIALEK
jgi:hypothetical protein